MRSTVYHILSPLTQGSEGPEGPGGPLIPNVLRVPRVPTDVQNLQDINYINARYLAKNYVITRVIATFMPNLFNLYYATTNVRIFIPDIQTSCHIEDLM